MAPREGLKWHSNDKMAEHTTNPAIRQIHNGDVLYHSYVRSGCPVVRWWTRFWCCFALVELNVAFLDKNTWISTTKKWTNGLVITLSNRYLQNSSVFIVWHVLIMLPNDCKKLHSSRDIGSVSLSMNWIWIPLVC